MLLQHPAVLLLLPLLRCRLNAMNEIWVPSEWQRESFAASGIAADKLRVVPEVRHRPLWKQQQKEGQACRWLVCHLAVWNHAVIIWRAVINIEPLFT